MRLDHIAFRVNDRKKTAQFFIEAFGYRIQDEFTINFDNGATAQCIALEPPEKVELNSEETPFPWISHSSQVFYKTCGDGCLEYGISQEYHIPPEIFVSDGEPGSPVYEWVQRRGGVGGIHHIAYNVNSVEEKMQEWREKGYAEFSTDKPLTCPGLTQVFTKPSELTGVIFEFIEREAQGFCKSNVKSLMESTKEFN